MKIHRIGSIIRDRYCLIDKISQGGEGSIYLAKDMHLGIFRAVKVLPMVSKKEAQILGKLHHPSIPKMIDYDENNEYCYIVMEWIRGKTLDAFIRENQNLTAEKIRKIAICILEILIYLHTQRPAVIYGDLKPDNLMITEKEGLYLIDFGSSRIEYGEKQAVNKGTPGFAAPEQYQGKMTEVSDIYAFGKLLQWMLKKQKKTWMCPGMLFVSYICTRKKEQRRFQNAQQPMQLLLFLQKLKRGIYAGSRIVLIALLSISIVALSIEKIKDRQTVFTHEIRTQQFSQELTAITECYYNEKKEKLAEEQLLKLLKKYPEEPYQKKILMLLAYHSEYSGDVQRAKVYYEQLLLYYPKEWKIYVQYGILLYENGEAEKSREVWKCFKKQCTVSKYKGDKELKTWACYLRKRGKNVD